MARSIARVSPAVKTPQMETTPLAWAVWCMPHAQAGCWLTTAAALQTQCGMMTSNSVNMRKSTRNAMVS